eukprot:2597177-Prymnesium_polylepis.1
MRRRAASRWVLAARRPTQAQRPLRSRPARSEVGARGFHLDEIQYAELALAAVDDEREEERRILPIDDARAGAKPAVGGDKAARGFGARVHGVEQLLDDRLLL